MKKEVHTLRTPLGIARGLGSAHSGFEHWIVERVSALILIPTTVYMLIGFVENAVKGGYSGAMYWLQSPFAAAVTILFMLAGLRHLVCGLQVVMEDYIHMDIVRLPLLFVVKCGAAFMAIIGTLSVAKIFFGV